MTPYQAFLLVMTIVVAVGYLWVWRRDHSKSETDGPDYSGRQRRDIARIKELQEAER